MKTKPLVKWFIIISIIAILLSLILLKIYGNNKLTKDNAEKRALEFAEMVNYEYKEPIKIYELMSEEYKEKISSKEFIEAFNKERSYPYLTPLYINFSSVELNENLKGGQAVYSQAARLPGMIYKVKLIYENNNYYIIAFEDFLDGSYLNKFENLSYSLDSYFDFKK